ncbi:ABC transporter ATP-binding protein [Paenibacillus bovis]|uniref:ABC transporter ATP-binding protein n=1 Tax=Paenibacillus bovis TaxID=1616788 RepID=A0A172ZD61_9BACL|nr:ABC transporter ATP-binding protein [Paenibacillus bovis]ANF95292.1 ABC transporter ATP-binding protein [Paenibacillus bovis]
MSLMFAFLKKYRVAAVLALLMMFIELALELLQPFLISKIIDDGVSRQDASTVLLWGGILVGGTIIAFVAGIFSSFYASYASQGLGYDLREALYTKVQSFSYALFSRFSSSSLITRLTNDVTILQDMLFMGLRFMLRMPLLVVGSSIMALIVNVKLGLLLVVGIPVLLLFVIAVMKRAAARFQLVQRRLDKVNNVMQENLTGMRLIRVFVRRHHERKRFEQHSGELMTDTVAALRLTETTMPFILFIMNASIIAVLWFGHRDIMSGSASVGEVVAIINYSMRTMGALSAFSMIVASFSRARASAERMDEVMSASEEVSSRLVADVPVQSAYRNADPDSIHADQKAKRDNGQRQDTASAASSIRSGSLVHENGELTKSRAADSLLNKEQPGIAFENVYFQYPGVKTPILSDISFAAREGRMTAIMGATGSGKSSLVQLLLRLYEVSSGHIYLQGQDIRQMSEQQLRGMIGYVPQEVVLFSGTIRDNIAWGNEHATMEEIAEAARMAQIHDTITQLPHGYDTLLGQRGVNLSGGQKQRLSIARALVRRPQILLLDDSTSALDVRTESLLLESLGTLSCTTILITQKISSTIRADKVLLLGDGQLIAQGNHEELLQQSELYRKIYASQFGEEELGRVEIIH